MKYVLVIALLAVVPAIADWQREGREQTRQAMDEARRARDDADFRAFALDAVDEVLSPAAEADDCCVDHVRPFDSDLSYFD